MGIAVDINADKSKCSNEDVYAWQICFVMTFRMNVKRYRLGWVQYMEDMLIRFQRLYLGQDKNMENSLSITWDYL